MAQIHMNIMADCFTNSIKLSRNTRNDFKMKDNIFTTESKGARKCFCALMASTEAAAGIMWQVNSKTEKYTQNIFVCFSLVPLFRLCRFLNGLRFLQLITEPKEWLLPFFNLAVLSTPLFIVSPLLCFTSWVFFNCGWTASSCTNFFTYPSLASVCKCAQVPFFLIFWHVLALIAFCN